MGGWKLGGWMGGWMDGWESRFKDCLQQSKISFNARIVQTIWPINVVEGFKGLH